VQLASWNGISIFGANNTSVTSVTINYPVQLIGDSAFQNCTGLTSVTIPSSVTSIGQNAFNGCTALSSITIPNSVTSIGQYAFSGCTGQLVSSVISQLASNSASNYTAGQQSVIANPNAYGLYTTSQIQNMAVGDLVLSRQVSGGFVLNYDIEQSTDLQTWTPYQALSLPMTNLPTNKAFIRIKAKQ
jgi:BspA type Leucine rich repeat region (6 copies)